MSHVVDYLSYYETQTKPGYGVLVTGPWGVGKTFQVQRALSDRRTFYVSLFGLTSTAEIYEAVFAAMFPEAAGIKQTADNNRDLSIGGVPIGQVATQFVRMFIRDRVDATGTLIFDDLERCSVPANELLGVVNRYLEHHGCRVIVIAHEGKLPEALIEQREKTIGQTVRVHADVQSAYEGFSIAITSPDARTLLATLKGELIALFEQSQVESLRVLRHALEDIARLCDCLTERHLEHADAMRDLILLYSSLNLERRAERIRRTDLINRMQAEFNFELARRANADMPVPAMVSAIRRYPAVPVEGELLPDTLLQKMLFDGVFPERQIQNALDASHHFARPAQIPDWQVFIQFQHRADEEVEAAMNRMSAAFASREAMESGSLLHVFSLRMMMAHHGLIDAPLEQVTRDCRDYIDHLKGRDQLPPLETSYLQRDDFAHGFGGFAFWIEPEYKAAFAEIHEYLRQMRASVVIERLPSATPELLAAVEADGEEFAALISYTSSDRAPKYAEVPVLAAIPPPAFVQAWMRSHPSNWLAIRKTIEERLRSAGRGELAPEVPWAREVVSLLQEEAGRSSAVRALRIRRLQPRVPDERL